jgi:hypothetical protein
MSDLSREQPPRLDSAPRPVPRERTLSVRVPDYLVQYLMGLGLIDETTLAEVIRKGLAAYVDLRRNEPGFSETLAAARARQLATLDRLDRARGAVGDRE